MDSGGIWWGDNRHADVDIDDTAVSCGMTIPPLTTTTIGHTIGKQCTLPSTHICIISALFLVFGKSVCKRREKERRLGLTKK